MPSPYDTFTCPHCGEELAQNASFCPECGSDAETGWSEFADYAGLDLPDEAEEDFEEQARAAPPSGWQQLLLGTAVLLIVLILWSIFRPSMF